MDLYDALIGEGPSDKARTAELAAALRRRRAFGQLGMLTGDKVLSPLGKSMSRSADDTASSLQDIRQKDIDNRRTQEYQQGQLQHMQGTLEESRRSANMRDETTRRGQDLDYEAAMLRAAIQAKKAAEGKPPKLTYSDRNKLENLSNLLHGAESLADGFKEEYTQKAGPGPQSRLSNTMASFGLGTQGMKEAANWWAQWNLIYTLPQRNITFGATLTPTEKQAWFESDINPAMDAKQIKERIGKVQDILKRKGKLATKTYKAQGFSPDTIDSYELGEETPAQQPGEGSPLDDAEMAELKALREKYGR